ncbi:hypothetical protein M409DRAFT_68591 [Zasmidium cellare ATCC 36951]|uniref:Aminopeptidase n=1 Tax=Zasmidium cellare ATCC 36951 TaxID=1080233 RepID=A0A6A6CCZ3_ZASCE|nr:uncharacterized protein M409DRAFT_68591 [Zasmidium cellare ATCC 36951]KAF2163316.1 hypothetical protein M409DRAFT_68591 [Zasmidium cellare ATCC 36951]
MSGMRDLLPDDVKPEHYSLTLSDLRIEAPWTYSGHVEIVLQVRRATHTIILNSHELKIHRAQVTVQNSSDPGPLVHSSSDISLDVEHQRCSIRFGVELQPSVRNVTLAIWFEGCANEYMAGFYRSQYTAPSGVATHMFSTQFEPSEARRAFPCFDEPASKATFDLQLEVPSNMTALSNMPVKTSRPSDIDERTIVTFERSPRMSTYLLSWAVGLFEFVEQSLTRKRSLEPLPIRVYTTQGLSQHGRRGLQVACDVVEYFSEMFDIEYPLPKLDLIAVHEMSDDAMENWGLVTFRPTALLYNETTSDPSYVSYITYIIAHELAHQWFGNITTMEWWDELWLNEGFATWAGWSACDHLHPDWKVWATFAADDMRTAFDLDGLRSSHPIRVPIPDGREVDSIFDSISYLKSASVIRMLAARLGLPAFLKGVSEYLKTNAYGNATAVALWEALEKASGQKVVSVMTSWIEDVGFPVVTVSRTTDNQIHVRQERFLLAGEPKPDESTTLWNVPMQVPTREGIRQVDLTDRDTVIEDVNSDSSYRLNAGQIGFYLTQVPAEEFERLCDNISTSSIEDQIGLLTDVATLAMSGRGSNTTAEVLSVISSSMTAKPSYPVLDITWFCLDRVQSIFSDDEDISDALDDFTQDIFGQAALDLGWTVQATDDHVTIKLRALVLSAAGLAGHEETVEEALKLWDEFRKTKDTSVIHPSLRGSVFSIAMLYRELEAFDSLREAYTNSNAPDTREIIVEAMSVVQTPELTHKCLTWALQGGMTSSDTSDLMTELAKNPAARETVWVFMREHWTSILERLGGSSAVMEPLIRSTLQTFTTRERREEVEAFFTGKDTTGYTRGLAIALERIGINAAYRERDGEVVRDWLEENDYLDDE